MHELQEGTNWDCGNKYRCVIPPYKPGVRYEADVSEPYEVCYKREYRDLVLEKKPTGFFQSRALNSYSYSRKWDVSKRLWIMENEKAR